MFYACFRRRLFAILSFVSIHRDEKCACLLPPSLFHLFLAGVEPARRNRARHIRRTVNGAVGPLLYILVKTVQRFHRRVSKLEIWPRLISTRAETKRGIITRSFPAARLEGPPKCAIERLPPRLPPRANLAAIEDPVGSLSHSAAHPPRVVAAKDQNYLRFVRARWLSGGEDIYILRGARSIPPSSCEPKACDAAAERVIDLASGRTEI